MTTTFITTDTNGPIVLNDNDEVFVVPDVNLTSAGDAFALAFNNGELKGSYEVFFSGNALVGDDFLSANFMATSPSEARVFVNFSADASVASSGDLFVLSGFNENITDSELAVNNSGFISVSEAAVVANGFDTVEFINSGVLTQTVNPAVQDLFDELGNGEARIINHGLIQAAQGASVIDDTLGTGGSLDVVNTGVISTTDEAAFRVFGTSATFSLVNSGRIVGDLQSGSELSFTNSGTYLGDITSSGTTDKIVNSGTIDGTISLGAGADSFKMAGNGFVSDAIIGGSGNDTLRGGNFDDTIDGGTNNDLLRGKNGEDDLTGGSGNDTLFGGNDNDSLTGDNGDDELQGGSGNDTLDGGGNRDRLIGGSDNDSLDGGQGNDTLLGGSGNDTLAGQNGQDALTGGAGADMFVFSNLSHSAVGGTRDVIRDFEKGTDKIDIEALSNSFVFIGSSGFSGTGDAEVRVSTNAFGNSVVRIDANGDGASDSEILVRGVTDLDAGDFIL